MVHFYVNCDLDDELIEVGKKKKKKKVKKKKH